jgi:hypothetical protein
LALGIELDPCGRQPDQFNAGRIHRNQAREFGQTRLREGTAADQAGVFAAFTRRGQHTHHVAVDVIDEGLVVPPFGCAAHAPAVGRGSQRVGAAWARERGGVDVSATIDQVVADTAGDAVVAGIAGIGIAEAAPGQHVVALAAFDQAGHALHHQRHGVHVGATHAVADAVVERVGGDAVGDRVAVDIAGGRQLAAEQKGPGDQHAHGAGQWCSVIDRQDSDIGHVAVAASGCADVAGDRIRTPGGKHRCAGHTMC